MCKMLLSINPKHVANIMNGKKIYEFRKNRCKEQVDKILIYSTSPVMRVVGEAELMDVLVEMPDNLWDMTHEFAGITKDFFDEYFRGRQQAIAYKLGKITEFDEPRKLSYYGVQFAPQSFLYI